MTPEIDSEPYQLYNLNDDLRQRKNLYATNPEKAKELKALAKELVVNGRSTPGKKQNNDKGYSYRIDWTEQFNWVNE